MVTLEALLPDSSIGALTTSPASSRRSQEIATAFAAASTAFKSETVFAGQTFAFAGEPGRTSSGAARKAA